MAIALLLAVCSGGPQGALSADAHAPDDLDGHLDSLEGSVDKTERAPGPDQVAMEPLPVPAVIQLSPGEVRSLGVAGITRVVIGKPEVADVSVVSANEVLLQAQAAGTTNLILWDQKGQHASNVEVVDRTPESTETQLRDLVRRLHLPSVQVMRQEGKLFLTGEVPTQADVDQLEQMLSAYTGQVTNLVNVLPSPPPPPPVPPQSVKLTVQLIELNRDATDKLGVDWADTLEFKEETFPVPAVTSDLHERIDEAFRLGSLSRTGFNPVLNMLVSQGKARILAEPKLVTASGKEATAFLGVEVPVLTATSVSAGTVTQSIEFKKVGVELKFTPTVLDNERSVQLAVDSKVSSIDKSVAIKIGGVTVPGFKTRQTQTEIVTDSGQSVLISGLLQEEEKRNLSQVPAVGSIPVLGNLFRSKEFTLGHTELIIVVTPEISAEGGPAGPDRAALLEQALAGAEVAASVQDPTIRYALQVQDRIAKAMQYPERGQTFDQGGRVKLRLHLSRDGTLAKAEIAESSGLEAFDREAVHAAESQSPYPPFPSDLPAQDLWLEVPVLFRP